MALEAIQAQAGHRSIETTRLYLHLSNDWLADEYQRAAARVLSPRAVQPSRRGLLRGPPNCMVSHTL